MEVWVDAGSALACRTWTAQVVPPSLTLDSPPDFGALHPGNRARKA